MANPRMPPQAKFPALPPLHNLQIADVNGYPTIPFMQFLQSIWAAIQGTGGLVDQTTDTLLSFDNTSAQAQGAIGRSPELTAMPSSYAQSLQQQQMTQTLQTISSVLGRISSLESLVLLGLTNRTILISQLDGPYTVAMLPAVAPTGKMAYVTDATAPTYLGALVGGGAVVTPCFFNATAWVSF